MTVLALNGGDNVIHRNGRRFDQAGSGVTRFALLRRAQKNPSDMAGRTICGAMRTLQWKAGREVVEIRLKG